MAWYAKGRPLHGVCFKKTMEKMGFSPSARLPAGIVKIIADGKGDVKGRERTAISTKTGEFESGFAQ
ncbi:hypothetical protein [Faecalibacterium prausnitzii]|uniref:Uncharacterized protein n=1 Tax=Faecalibacterium prausnitzii TaxID=853 RepID=A0A2A7ALU0_9FIRM|nr:hypothetical protein [Faecalibacterium prausnitzii]PDX80079.1 hypothetical protein CGS58_14290 [Faecalibacterium prausnitzii]